MVDAQSPTTLDTIENRMKEFAKSAISEFVIRADYEIRCAEDKDSVKVKNGFGRYSGKFIEYGTMAIVFGATGGIGPYKLAGKVAGAASTSIIGAVYEKHGQSKGHNFAKKIQHLLVGLSANEHSWISTLTDVFIDIFIQYNVPFSKLLENPVDAWTKIMGKFAQDAVFRIFDYLKEEIDNIDEKEITKQFLLKAFLLGKSNLKTWKKVTRQERGRKIKMKTESGVEKIIMTSEVFDKPLQIMFKNGQYRAKIEPTEKSLEFKFRHLFDYEEAKLCVGPDEWMLVDVIKSEMLKEDDQKGQLTESRESIFCEIVEKFMGKDEEILKYVKKSIEYFEEMLKSQESVKEEIATMQSDTTEILDRVRSIEYNQNKEISTIVIGNPGRGKSTILNNLAGEELFKSGPSVGEGLTKKLEKNRNNKGEVFLDTPGFSDRELRLDAATAISNALRQSGRFKVIFVICEEDGIVDEEDILTMKSVLDAASDIGMNYGIIVNMVSDDILEDIDGKSKEFLEKALKEIPKANRCLDNRLLFLGEIKELVGEHNCMLPEGDSNLKLLTDFVKNEVPIVNIDSKNVKDIQLYF